MHIYIKTVKKRILRYIIIGSMTYLIHVHYLPNKNYSKIISMTRIIVLFIYYSTEHNTSSSSGASTEYMLETIHKINWQKKAQLTGKCYLSNRTNIYPQNNISVYTLKGRNRQKQIQPHLRDTTFSQQWMWGYRLPGCKAP